ncbi:MAG: C-type lectin domain-containing protein [Myxococcota bacterium]|jgi:Lectin C-type domain|nr:C-type lectin domain-containing protein [Myxococcota bacterium]
MRFETRGFADFTTLKGLGLLRFALALSAFAACSCTTTLDPTVLVGGGGAGGDPGLSPCELFTSASREYLVCPERLDNAEAAADCARRDATLAAIESREENDFVAARSESVMLGDWWLGGRRDDALVWSWPSGAVFWRGGPDGVTEPGAFSFWKGGEPNNESTTSPDPERCLALTPADDWNDRACSLKVPYICERAP